MSGDVIKDSFFFFFKENSHKLKDGSEFLGFYRELFVLGKMYIVTGRQRQLEGSW